MSKNNVIIILCMLFGFNTFAYKGQDSVSNSNPEKASSPLSEKILIYISEILDVSASSDQLIKDYSEREPAKIIFTVPKNDTNSYLIDINIKLNSNKIFNYDLSGGNYLIDLYPFVEFHRNSLIEKKQYNFKYGVGAFFLTRSLIGGNFNLAFNLNFGDSRNYIKNEWSYQTTLYSTFNFNKTFLKYIFSENPVFKNIGKFRLLSYKITPIFGLENKNIYMSNQDSIKGNLAINIYRLQGSLYLVEKFIQLTADLEWRNVFTNNTSNSQKMYNKKSFSFVFNFLKTLTEKIDFSFGVEYVKGESPLDGLTYQEYWAYSFRLKL